MVAVPLPGGRYQPEWAAARGVAATSVPRCHPGAFIERYRKIAGAIADGLVQSAHAPGLGGMLPALFRIARAGGVGLTVDLAQLPGPATLGWEARLFSESCGRLLLTCTPQQLTALVGALEAEPLQVVGETNRSGRLKLTLGVQRTLVDAELAPLARAWGSVA